MFVHFITSFGIGIISAEVLGYFWHRFVAHKGILKRITPYDFLRKRHVAHHEMYNSPTITPELITDSYAEACDVTFNVLAIFSYIVLSIFVWLGYLSIWTLAALILGSLFFAFAFLVPFHTYYHLTDEALQKRHLFQPKAIWKIFKWLQDYHLAHHYYSKNYSIVFPVDIFFGSYMPVAEFRRLRAAGLLKKESLFPGFMNSLSYCKQPLFKK